MCTENIVRIILEPFRELYDLAISEISDDIMYVGKSTRLNSKELDLISWNLVVQALMGIFTPHLYMTYFRPGIRLLDRDEIDSILAVISKLIAERGIHIEEEKVVIMERAIERLLVSQGWPRGVAWERASYLSREFLEKLNFN